MSGCVHTLSFPLAARQEYDEDGRGELDAHEVRAAVRDSTEQVRSQSGVVGYGRKWLVVCALA